MTELAELAAELVAIDSVNPDLIPGGAGEGEIARLVAGWLERAGLEVSVEEVAPGRPNVVGVARGSGGGRTLMLNAHLDTVGLGGPDGALTPRVEGGRLYGRGSYDMKASLAAIMLAGAECARRGLRGDVIVTAVADEEVASLGTEAICKKWSADAAIVSEPTEERVCSAHKGFVAFEIETLGKAAHGSRPDLGVDAIARMGRALVGVEALDSLLRLGPAHPLLGTGSLHAGVIEGGREYSSYPGRCLLTGERRTIPGEGVEQVERELSALLGDVEGRATVTSWRPPLETPADAEIVRLLLRHANQEQAGGVPFWTDSALLTAAGIPTVVYGPAGEGAHADVEWVDVASAERCRDVYVAVAADLCG